MKKNSALLAFLLSALVSTHSPAAVLTSIPGPDAQGGMIMPMVMLDEGTKTLSFMMDSYVPPMLVPLNVLKPGDSFEPADAWYDLLNPLPQGAGALFSSRFGFMSMSVSLPSNLSLAIKLTSLSSNLMQGWNYVDGSPLFDLAFSSIGDQVLWDGGMWHTIFTLPSGVPAGTYTASFEVFIADMAFSDGTGYVDYSSGVQSALPADGYNTVEINYTWTAIPEPSTYMLLSGAVGIFGFLHLRRRKTSKA